ncbi:unnamed protein product [Nyctereutes procyonoides]|uniref:(raccoon dog) hypothetical protein n=1 Tax=Nyctereutes procyonoides TaxID=34880 RepID=A0A811ZZ73_NYCPR|nr:unnamed protein product [Nyctereutes procyonoides]
MAFIFLNLHNLHSFNSFADASKGDDLLPAGTEDYIHIRISREGAWWLSQLSKFACNGTVIVHPEYGEVIRPQGDQHRNICQFLLEIGLAKDNQLKVHGF